MKDFTGSRFSHVCISFRINISMLSWIFWRRQMIYLSIDHTHTIIYHKSISKLLYLEITVYNTNGISLLIIHHTCTCISSHVLNNIEYHVHVVHVLWASHKWYILCRANKSEKQYFVVDPRMINRTMCVFIECISTDNVTRV